MSICRSTDGRGQLVLFLRSGAVSVWKGACVHSSIQWAWSSSMSGQRGHFSTWACCMCWVKSTLFAAVAVMSYPVKDDECPACSSPERLLYVSHENDILAIIRTNNPLLLALGHLSVCD